MNHCGECKFWGKPDERQEQFRSCMAVVHDKAYLTNDDVIPEEWELRDDDNGFYHQKFETAKSYRAEHKAVVQDGSGFRAALRTREDFACNLWEAKE